jgi:ferritin-like protein
MSSETLHEERSQLSPQTIDQHRAIVSLMEELEAVDWYNQRQEAATDPELKEILAHNRDEEKEHAMMVLEWLRRRDPKFDEMIGTYINSSGNIIQVEKAETAAEAAGETGASGPGRGGSAGGGSLGIGSLKTVRPEAKP